MKMSANPQQYIIQVDLPPATAAASRGQPATARPVKAPVDLKMLQRLFDETGIKLDANYRPICVNSQQQRFVVRGRATPEARRAAERKLGGGVKFFSDGPVQAMNVRPKGR